MYITTKQEDSSSDNSATNSRAFQLCLKQVIACERSTMQRIFFLRQLFNIVKMPVFAAYFVLAGCALTASRVEREIIDAWNRNEPAPLAHLIDETLTIERAYEIQTRIVRKNLRGRSPSGFKAGLTSKPSQQRFDAPGPIAGVLIMTAMDTPPQLKLTELRGLHLETEVAMRIGKPIRDRVASIEELRSHIDGIAPAIELPNLDYARADQLNALDIVASNVAAAYFRVGEFVAPASRDANGTTPVLECDRKEVNRGRARDAMGDQWAAALWLVNTALEHGWTLEPGQVLLTGALGKMVPAQPGHCIADFGEWGKLEVHITE
jgi:2-keto-4-pentenoate hydratase